MFGQPISLGYFLGLHVRIDTTLLILLGMYALQGASNGGGTEGAIHALTFIVFILISIFLHEYGHALAASFFGIGTHEVVLHFFGGYARLSGEPRTPFQEATIALAGPLVNLALALTLYLLLLFIESDGDRYQLFAPVVDLVYSLYRANFILGIFNLLPGFPLDGGSVLRAILSVFIRRAQARVIVAYAGVAIGFGLAAWDFPAFTPQVILGLLLVYMASMEAISARRSIM